MSGIFVLSPDKVDRHPHEWEDLAFVFEESVHGAIFDATLDPSEWPQLYRMSDWYGAATYQGDDLVAFVEELKWMMPRWPPKSAPREALRGLLAVCQNAIEGKRVLQWLGD
jgi:hypothetical protein